MFQDKIHIIQRERYYIVFWVQFIRYHGHNALPVTISLRGLFNIFIIALLLSYGATVADNNTTQGSIVEEINLFPLFI